MQDAIPSPQQDTLNRRLPIVIVILIFISSALVVRMLLFQAPPDPRVAAEVQRWREANYSSTRRETSSRGIIYDRTGQRLAVNSVRYRVGITLLDGFTASDTMLSDMVVKPFVPSLPFHLAVASRGSRLSADAREFLSILTGIVTEIANRP